MHLHPPADQSSVFVDQLNHLQTSLSQAQEKLNQSVSLHKEAEAATSHLNSKLREAELNNSVLTQKALTLSSNLDQTKSRVFELQTQVVEHNETIRVLEKSKDAALHSKEELAHQNSELTEKAENLRRQSREADHSLLEVRSSEELRTKGWCEERSDELTRTRALRNTTYNGNSRC